MAAVVILPFGEGKLGGEDYRVRYTMPNYGLLPVASGKLGADGRIALDGIAPSGKEPYDGRYTVEVGGHQLGHFRVEDRPARQEFTFQMPPRVGDRAPDAMAIDLDLASRNARDLEDDLYNRLAKEHEFNDPRWPFVIKVRDVQNRALIDATLQASCQGEGRVRSGHPGEEGHASWRPGRQAPSRPASMTPRSSITAPMRASR